MKNRGLTWRHLRALHQLYVNKTTDAKILDNGFIKNVMMVQRKLIRHKSGNLKILEATSGYASFYESNFKDNYEHYAAFLSKEGLEDDGRKRYTEDDIRVLMFIADQRQELAANLTTIKTFSARVFEGYGSKYLENKPGLKKAVCNLLGILDFPEKDPKNLQWRLVVDCINPVAVILCENISHLKSAWKARRSNIELWYVGGNNIGILDHLSEEKLSKPVYYSCDWDFHGLAIYSRVKGKLEAKLKTITLLKPYRNDLSIPVDVQKHGSKWDCNLALSGLKSDDFDSADKNLITTLIQENKWIEEESMEFDFLIAHNNVLKN